jgi:hypothetical protein
MNGAPASRTASRFGPWVAGIDPVERGKQFRSLAALTAAFFGSEHRLVLELRQAESDADAAARALDLLDKLPSLTKRRLLSVFGSITWPQPRRAP